MVNKEVIYLDHAAATPVSKKVLAAMEPYFSELFFNPSAPYAPAVSVRRDYESAKQVIARAIGAAKTVPVGLSKNGGGQEDGQRGGREGFHGGEAG